MLQRNDHQSVRPVRVHPVLRPRHPARLGRPTRRDEGARIGQQLQPPLTLTDGFIRFEPSNDNGNDSGKGTGLGLGAGLGYFVTDAIEIGASLSLQLLKLGQGDAQVGPGATPFVRFMTMQGKTGLFAEVVAEFRRLADDNSSTTVLGFGADIGVEIFVTDDWAARLSPTFRHLSMTNTVTIAGTDVSSDSSANRFGVTWGLAAYF